MNGRYQQNGRPMKIIKRLQKRKGKPKRKQEHRSEIQENALRKKKKTPRAKKIVFMNIHT